MLTCFKLNRGVEIEDFHKAYTDFVKYMRNQGLVETTGSIGERQNDTRMDTDKERDHKYFVIMSFRDRAQVDAAYAHLKPHTDPAESVHKAVYSKVQDPVFICWQDLP
jgi:hypothetical protein